MNYEPPPLPIVPEATLQSVLDVVGSSGHSTADSELLCLICLTVTLGEAIFEKAFCIRSFGNYDYSDKTEEYVRCEPSREFECAP